MFLVLSRFNEFYQGQSYIFHLLGGIDLGNILHIWNLFPSWLMWTLWREKNWHTFEDAKCSTTQLQTLLLRAMFDTHVWSFTTSISIVDFKEWLCLHHNLFFVILYVLWPWGSLHFQYNIITYKKFIIIRIIKESQKPSIYRILSQSFTSTSTREQKSILNRNPHKSM